MAASYNISEARARLPQIAQSLVREPGSVVYIDHRDLDERLVVTTERHLRYLETMIERLRERAGATFSLAGSIQAPSDEDVDAVLAEIRAEGAGLAAEKLDGI